MKILGEVTYNIGIKIHRDKSRGALGLSQEAYINKVLERFWMKSCSPRVAPIMRGGIFNLDQMKNIPYASAVGSLIYA